MPSINKVQLIGNLTDNIELQLTKNGKKVSNFTLATDESWKNKEGEVIRNTSFHKMVAWNGLADFASKVGSKGRLMYIEGKLINREYEDANNVKRHVTEVIVSGLKPLDYKKSTNDLPELGELPVEDLEIEIVEEGELVAA